MPDFKRFSISEIKSKPSVLNKLPIEITRNKKVIARVIPPDMEFKACEKCNVTTSNNFQYKDSDGKWQEIILCDKHADLLS